MTRADVDAGVISGLFGISGPLFGYNQVLDLDQVKKEKHDGTVRR
jgi:hypothetical protein